MKRMTIFLAILLISAITKAQGSELIGQLDSIIHVSYDANTRTLKFESKSIFQYGQNKNPETPDILVKYSWDNNQQSWIADSGFVYEYNKNGKEISCEARFYDINKPENLAWTLATKTESEYDKDGNRSLMIINSWDANTSDWIQTKKEEYYYAEDFKDSLSKTFLWDQNQKNWLNDQKSESEYDSFGNKVLVVTYDWFEGGAIWTVKSQYEYTCDENRNTIVQKIYNQDEGTGAMNLYRSKEYEYDLSSSKVWDPCIVEHQNSLRSINYRDASGTIYATDTLYYSQVESTSSVMEPLQISNFKIYPNPASYHITIKGSDEGATFELYSQNGKKVMSCKVQINQQIDVSILPKGFYLYKYLSINGKTKTGKLIKNN